MKNELNYSGMLVKELADQTGLKKHTIDNYLSVRGRMPSADAAVRIARALEVSVEYLITGKETTPDKRYVHFSPDIRTMVYTAEKLKPEHRKIAMAVIDTLKKIEDSQTKID